MIKSTFASTRFVCAIAVAVWLAAPGAPADGSQLFAAFNGLVEEEIWRANGEGLGVRVVLTGLADVKNVEVDEVNHKLLWAELDLGISRADFDGSNVETLVFAQGAQVVRLDLALGKMYYAVYNKIWRADLDGSSQELLVTDAGNVQDIALDLATGFIYWGEPVNSKLRRCNLDGSGIQDVLLGHDPVGLALDLSAGKIYWSDGNADMIRRANLNGSNVEDLLPATNANDLDINFELGKLYYSESPFVKRVNLDGSSPETILTGFEQARGIAIDTTPIFVDGFESGDTSAWSNTVP